MAGNVGDWQITDIKKDFVKEYPDLLDKKIDSPPEALFESKIGKISMIMDFSLKGTMKKIMTNIKVWTRIEDPHEILDQETARGSFLMNHFNKINDKYKQILNSVDMTNKKMVAFRYKNDHFAISSTLSNEVQFRNMNKFILIAREIKGYIHVSLRSQKHDVRALVEKVLPEFNDAKGGGHKHACGASLNAEDYEDFVARVSEELDNYKE
jgi:oligoribonuclease NrnB/cAMP/cGMP phosphodiesterase (DHH superfamily)